MARKTQDMADMFLAFQAFMESQGSAAPVAKPATRKARATRSSGKVGTPAATLNAKRTRTTTTPSRKTAKGVITCGEAWNALGADPTYTPSDPNAPARNGQLWALNAAGKLALR